LDQSQIYVFGGFYPTSTLLQWLFQTSGYIISPVDLITSTRNPKIRLARSLHARKNRSRQGLFLVEGIRHVGEALEAGAAVEYLCYAPDLLRSDFGLGVVEGWQARGVPTYATSAEVFTWLADREGPQGLLAVARQRLRSLDELTPADHPWALALLAPQDPGNLGAILRTMDAVGAGPLILLEGGVDPYHPTAVRASMGALFWHPITAADRGAFSTWVRRHNYAVYGSSAQADTDYRSLPGYALPGVLLLGSEREGLPADLRTLCTATVRLPMAGRVSSLNLAVAAGVLLYDMAARLQGAG
jgi:TrmH family RNA methyltransferase